MRCVLNGHFEGCWDLQAESDHHVKDTYNFVTVRSDVRMPARHIRYLHDSARWRPLQAAVVAATAKLAAEDKDVRMLLLGAGAGEEFCCHLGQNQANLCISGTQLRGSECTLRILDLESRRKAERCASGPVIHQFA